MPRLSVLMSVYNAAPFLDSAIASICAQSFSDFEFLIINDGSNDDSARIIREWATRDSRIVAVHRENRGLIASLNQLIEAASCDLLARMDADDIAEPERFARQMAYFDSHPECDILGTWTRDIAEDGSDLRRITNDQPVMHDDIVATLEAANPFCHPTVIMRRDIVRQVGGYHAAYRHCEDYDLWLRLAPLAQMHNIPERLVLYRRTSNQITHRHITEMHYGACVARQAYRWRLAGAQDPTERLTELPPPERLSDLFGSADVGHAVAREFFTRTVYARDVMQGPHFEQLLAYVRNGGERTPHWRTVARLAFAMRDPVRAARLGLALMGA